MNYVVHTRNRSRIHVYRASSSGKDYKQTRNMYVIIQQYEHRGLRDTRFVETYDRDPRSIAKIHVCLC